MTEKIQFTMPNVFQLADIEKQCFGVEAWTINNLRGEFSNPFSHFFGEVVDGKIVGYACVRIMYEEAQICNVCVLPNFRRQGIATRLMDAVKQLAVEHECERCELEVNTENAVATAMYKKCGYEIQGIRKNFYRRTSYNSRDAYTMVLQLKQPIELTD